MFVKWTPYALKSKLHMQCVWSCARLHAQSTHTHCIGSALSHAKCSNIECHHTQECTSCALCIDKYSYLHYRGNTVYMALYNVDSWHFTCSATCTCMYVHTTCRISWWCHCLQITQSLSSPGSRNPTTRLSWTSSLCWTHSDSHTTSELSSVEISTYTLSGSPPHSLTPSHPPTLPPS